MIRIADGFLNSKVNAQSVKTYVCHQIQVRRPLTAEKRVQDLRNEAKAVDNTPWGYIIKEDTPEGYHDSAYSLSRFRRPGNARAARRIMNI